MSTQSAFPNAFFKNGVVPTCEAKISIMSKVVQYGLGWFGGVRGYLSHDMGYIGIFRLDDHIERFFGSAKILGTRLKYSKAEIKNIFLDLVKANMPKTDIYFRPFAFCDSTDMTPCFAHNTEFSFALYMMPLGDYIPTDKGNPVCVSTWRRVSDNAIPSRAKISGAYVNSTLAKNEAVNNGFAEAIELDEVGQVTEGTAMNLFIVKNGELITPSSSSDILEGITRRSVIEIAQDMGINTVERPVDRTELYVADEAFFCGTGAQIAWISEIDRRTVGNGTIGQVSKKIKDSFFDIVRAKSNNHQNWLTKIKIQKT